MLDYRKQHQLTDQNGFTAYDYGKNVPVVKLCKKKIDIIMAKMRENGVPIKNNKLYVYMSKDNHYYDLIKDDPRIVIELHKEGK